MEGQLFGLYLLMCFLRVMYNMQTDVHFLEQVDSQPKKVSPAWLSSDQVVILQATPPVPEGFDINSMEGSGLRPRVKNCEARRNTLT